jgi:hypothetical protein
MTEGLAASRCEPRREIRGAEYETDVRRSEEQILLKMVIYPNAIVDHHFDGLKFLFNLLCCLFLLLPVTVAFTLRLCCNHSGCCVCLISVCWLLRVTRCISSFVRITNIGRVINIV